MSSWISVCTLDDIPEQGARTLRAGDIEIGVFRLADGRVLAVENRCPHKQGPLAEGIVSGHVVICPLHSRRIDLENGKVQPPDSGCVKTYAVKVEGGAVHLEL